MFWSCLEPPSSGIQLQISHFVRKWTDECENINTDVYLHQNCVFVFADTAVINVPGV
jgi:hypothetical protein